HPPRHLCLLHRRRHAPDPETHHRPRRARTRGRGGMTPLRPVVIAGVGMTAFGKFLGRSLKSLAAEAVAEAMADAGAPVDDVEFVYFANVFGGLMQNQESIRGQVWLAESSLQGVPTINVENACASGSSALHQAWVA